MISRNIIFTLLFTPVVIFNDCLAMRQRLSQSSDANNSSNPLHRSKSSQITIDAELRMAAFDGNFKKIEKILKNKNLGSKIQLITQKNDSGFTALHFAILGQNQNIIKLFINTVGQKQLPLIINKNGNNILHLAAYGGSPEIVKLVCHNTHHKLLFSVNKTGNTPLHLAALNGYSNVVFELLKFCITTSEKNELTEIKNYDGKRAIDLAFDFYDFDPKYRDISLALQ